MMHPRPSDSYEPRELGKKSVLSDAQIADPRSILDTFPNPRPGRDYNDFWELQPVGTLELIEGMQPELLPPDAGLQVIIGETLDPAMSDTAVDSSGTFRERYASYGLILFDSQGRLLQSRYRIDGGSRLGRALQVTPPGGTVVSVPNTGVDFPTSQLGVVLYLQSAFESAASDGTALHWRGSVVQSANDAAVIANFTTGTSDFYPLWSDFNALFQPDATTAIDEYAEERWLDANTIPLMVNRYSGTLVEAE